MKKTLPNKPSELLKLAMKDLGKCERSPKYNVHMMKWHSGFEREACYVCLAGSVMAKTFNEDPKTEHHPGDYDNKTAMKLHWLDDARMGRVYHHTDVFSDKIQLKLLSFDHVSFPRYGVNRTLFKAGIRKIVKQLQAAGI